MYLSLSRREDVRVSNRELVGQIKAVNTWINGIYD